MEIETGSKTYQVLNIDSKIDRTTSRIQIPLFQHEVIIDPIITINHHIENTQPFIAN